VVFQPNRIHFFLQACRALLEAAKSGDVNSTKRLVKCINDNCISSDVFRHTPLTFAARNGHVEVVQVLLEAGTNMDRSSASGWTALHVAARYERLDVCRLLLDWGAKADPLNDGRDTPMHLAARHGHLSVVQLLANRGADASLKNGDGYTARDSARLRGKKEVEDWLHSIAV
jgi:ankyrin repeat protein